MSYTYPCHQNDYMQLFCFRELIFWRLQLQLHLLALAESILEKCNSSWGKTLGLQLHFGNPRGIYFAKITLTLTFFNLSGTLKTLTSLNKEVRSFSYATIAFGVSPLFLSSAITAFGGSGGNFILAIIEFGAFQCIVPKYSCRLGKMESKESRLLI